MFSTLSLLPLGFWLVAILIICGFFMAKNQIFTGIGFPMIGVLATITAWYVGDAFYNNYAENHMKSFTPAILTDAWLEVAWFLLVFLVLVKPINESFNRRHLANGSQILRIAMSGRMPSTLQDQITPLFTFALVLYLLLSVWATFRLGPEVVYYFCPYLDHKAEPWARDRIGQGIDSLLALAGYLQIFSFSVFGLTAALSKKSVVRSLAIFACLLSWPYYFFDRTRNTMLLIALPGILAWVFLRIRANLLVKLSILSVFFVAISIWFTFVVSNRTEMTIAQAAKEKSILATGEETVGHEGLNMFEELCWINKFIDEGTYNTSWGQSYFANIVNPIPRSLWPNKPMIAIDYAIARGFGGGEKAGAGVVASISTGVIGQGVVNFGRFAGPAFVGLLLSFWVALLARLDYLGLRIGRLPLYILGMVMTFNLGRDVSLLTLYPLIFGWIIAILIENKFRRLSKGKKAVIWKTTSALKKA